MARFAIKHMMVQEGQKHSDELFRTDNPATAKAWLDMGCFIVWDAQAGKVCYEALDVDLCAATH